MEDDRRKFLKSMGALLSVPIIGCGDSSSKEADAGLDALVADKSVDTRLHIKPYKARNLEDDKTGHVKDIHPKDFDYEVLQAIPPVLVDFYATWCGPCKYMAPIFEDLAKIVVGMKFVTFDVDKDLTDISHNDYGVYALPTYHFFHEGEWHQKYGVLGANKSKLEQMIGLFFKDHGITNGVVYPDGGVEADASVAKDASPDMLLDAALGVDAGSMKYDPKFYNPKFRNYDPKTKELLPVGDYCNIKTRNLHKVF